MRGQRFILDVLVRVEIHISLSITVETPVYTNLKLRASLWEEWDDQCKTARQRVYSHRRRSTTTRTVQVVILTSCDRVEVFMQNFLKSPLASTTWKIYDCMRIHYPATNTTYITNRRGSGLARRGKTFLWRDNLAREIQRFKQAKMFLVSIKISSVNG